jgi:hypothetical protein
MLNGDCGAVGASGTETRNPPLANDVQSASSFFILRSAVGSKFVSGASLMKSSNLKQISDVIGPTSHPDCSLPGWFRFRLCVVMCATCLLVCRLTSSILTVTSRTAGRHGDSSSHGIKEV